MTRHLLEWFVLNLENVEPHKAKRMLKMWKSHCCWEKSNCNCTLFHPFSRRFSIAMFDSQLLHASVARNFAVSAGVDRRKQELERDKWKAAAARPVVWCGR